MLNSQQSMKMSQDAEKLVEEGIELYKKGEKDQAFTIFNKAVGLDPSNARALGNRGRMFFDQNKFGKLSQISQKLLNSMIVISCFITIWLTFISVQKSLIMQ